MYICCTNKDYLRAKICKYGIILQSISSNKTEQLK